MKKAQEEKIIKLFQSIPEIKLGYLFGSQAQKKAQPNSDYDFAIYLEETDSNKRFHLRLKVADEIAEILETDNIDLLILNDLEFFELKYEIIHDGKLIYEVGGYKLEIEPRIMNEYFDFRDSLIRNGLTKK